MDQFVNGIARFQSLTFSHQRALYETLAHHGQNPKALVISCSDSRVVPEAITQSGPGEVFVVRNAGNIVPPYNEIGSGVTAAIEYAVVGLKVQHIIVCGHTDCGAMKAVLKPSAVKDMPSVAKWLAHAECAHDVFSHVHAKASGKLDDKEAARLLAMENVAAQLIHLRTHPCVAARLATGELVLHGWLFDIASGSVLALDGDTQTFAPVVEDKPLPIALAGHRRCSVTTQHLVAAE